MNSDRIDVLHIADRDNVACGVPHYLILDFLPSCDTALYEYLSYSGKSESVFEDFFELSLVMGNTAAGST